MHWVINNLVLLKCRMHITSCYGVRGEANKWISEFLKNRKQQVNVNGCISFSQTITCGVPQGSTLGPLLFLIYINDLHRVFDKCIVHHFADDTNLIFPSKKVGTIESTVNNELKLLVEWLKANKLSLNESKTELIIFQSPNRRLQSKISIKLNNYKLCLKPDVTYLGVTIDEVLSWQKHIQNVSSKLSSVNGIISKLRHFTSKRCTAVYLSHFILFTCSLRLSGLAVFFAI